VMGTDGGGGSFRVTRGRREGKWRRALCVRVFQVFYLGKIAKISYK
jgi:hypothetical protein